MSEEPPLSTEKIPWKSGFDPPLYDQCLHAYCNGGSVALDKLLDSLFITDKAHRKHCHDLAKRAKERQEALFNFKYLYLSACNRHKDSQKQPSSFVK